jgi:hypothetical protein
MAFVDALIASSDADVVIVDRRHRPGGHWLDAYPFVRLHQPSATYGVNSTRLGHDRIDQAGINAGFYERATAAEICDYFARVLDDVLIASGQVRFLGMTEYCGEDAEGHKLRSALTGEETTVRVRKRIVDATYVESEIPSRHSPPFTVDGGVRMIPPNDLVHLDPPAAGFTVLGAGKTAMDTCNWLLDAGVDPDAIEWFRPREPWLFNRASMQPLDLVGGYMHLQACWVTAAAQTSDGFDFAKRLEAEGILVRLDSRVETEMFRGPIISAREIEALSAIERVVMGHKVRHIGTDRIVTDQGDVPTRSDRVHIDCTAAGVRPTVVRPVFEDGRITLQYVTIGNVPWSAANIGAVEARDDSDAAKNGLCPVVVFTGRIADVLHMSYAGLSGLMARTMDPVLGEWAQTARLNVAAAAAEHMDDPRVPAAYAAMGQHFGAAMENLERLTAAPS